MASSLGIFIEKDIIKYAKLNQEKDSIKVESFSVEFYEKGNVGAAVKKILTETNGAKCSVNVNVSSELYNYFETGITLIEFATFNNSSCVIVSDIT